MYKPTLQEFRIQFTWGSISLAGARFGLGAAFVVTRQLPWALGPQHARMETTIVDWGYIGIMEKKMETTVVYWGYIGIMEKKMETTVVYWGYIGIMEKKMETTVVYWGYIGIMANQMETIILYGLCRYYICWAFAQGPRVYWVIIGRMFLF